MPSQRRLSLLLLNQDRKRYQPSILAAAHPVYYRSRRINPDHGCPENQIRSPHVSEITLEANPDDINDLKARQWLNLGINRLSIGIQSFAEAELKWMNRIHTAENRCDVSTISGPRVSNFPLI